MIVKDSIGKGALAKYDVEAIQRKRKEIDALLRAKCQKMTAVAPMTEGGISFPITPERYALNKVSEDGGGSGTNKPSYNIRCTVGSLANVTGSGVYTDPKGQFAMVPLRMSEKGYIHALPISRVTKEPITHVAIVTGSHVRLFTGAEPDGVTLRMPAYAVMAVASLTAPVFHGKDATEFTQISALLDKANLKPPVAAAAATATATTAVGKGPAEVSGRDAFVKSAATAATASPDDDASSPVWYRPTKWATLPYPTAAVVAGYLDQSSRFMTTEERRCFECEHPEFAYCPPGSIEPSRRTAVNWRCGSVMPIAPQQFADQNHGDCGCLIRSNDMMENNLVELYKMRIANPGPIDGVAASPHANDTFFICQRSGDERDYVEGARQEEVAPPEGRVPVLTSVFWEPDSPGTFSCTGKFNGGGERFCLRFAAGCTLWSEEESYETAKKNGYLYNAILKCNAFEDIIASSLGISSRPTVPLKGVPARANKMVEWKNFASRFVTDPSFIAFACQIDWPHTKLMPSNVSSSITDHTFEYNMKVVDIFADMAGFLEKSAIPITAEDAASLLLQAMPPPNVLAAAKPTRIGSTVLLSEEGNANKLPDAIAAECDFYVMCSREVDHRIIQMFTKNTGSALLKDNWNGNAAIPVEVRKIQYDEFGSITSTTVETQTLDARHEIRTATKGILEKSSFVQVWAVRPNVKLSAIRACAGMQIFKSGGKYDARGFPIIVDPATATAAAAAPAATPEPETKKRVDPPSEGVDEDGDAAAAAAEMEGTDEEDDADVGAQPGAFSVVPQVAPKTDGHRGRRPPPAKKAAPGTKN